MSERRAEDEATREEASETTERMLEKAAAYDVFKQNRLLWGLVGFTSTINSKYFIYVTFFMAIHLYVQAMAFYAIYLLAPDVSMILGSLHSITISLFAEWGIGIKFFGNKDLMRIMEKIKSGIYNYEGEELDEENIRLKTSIPGEIRRKFNATLYAYALGFVSNTVFFPLSQYLSADKVKGDYPRFINPYMTHLFYNPFDDPQAPGYFAMFVLYLFFLLFIYIVCIRLTGLYATCAINLKTHFKLLNHSIATIQRRAYSLYAKNCRVRLPQENLLENKDFQKYLYHCLKANIKHHQALLRFREDCKFFVGSIILEVFVLAAIIYASLLYQLYQPLPFNVQLNWACTNVAAQTYSFFICLLGEELITESDLTCTSLYSTNWMHYDESFKKSMEIMMVYSQRPADFRAILMNIPASILTFGNNLSAMYKITNVASHSDILN